MLPGMTVINTCDFNQTKLATTEISNFDGPVYLRFGRPKVPNFTDVNDGFKIGEGVLLKGRFRCYNCCYRSPSLGITRSIN